MVTSTATGILQKEWEKANRLAEFQSSAATALKASVAPYDLWHKSSLLLATSAVQKAIESMDSLLHTNHSTAQKVGRSLADYDFGLPKFDLGPVAKSMSGLSILKESLAMHKLAHMGVWGDSERHQEVAKAVQRMLEPLRGLDAIRDSIAAQTSVKFGMIAELQKSMERYSTVNIAQKTSISLLGASALQEAIGLKPSAIQQAVKTMKHMRLFEESESIAKAIRQMDSVGALAKSIQALSHEDFFARAVDSINAMSYEPQYEPDISDIELAVNTYLINNSNESTFLDVFDNLNPNIRLLIVFVFLQILMPQWNNTISSLYTTPIVEQFIKSRKLNTEEIRTIKKAPLQDVDTSRLRFVVKNDVKLRAKPSTSSDVLDALVIGQVITILERKKGWAEIAYVNDDDQTCQGWIMTRYTAKFRK